MRAQYSRDRSAIGCAFANSRQQVTALSELVPSFHHYQRRSWRRFYAKRSIGVRPINFCADEGCYILWVAVEPNIALVPRSRVPSIHGDSNKWQWAVCCGLGPDPLTRLGNQREALFSGDCAEGIIVKGHGVI